MPKWTNDEIALLRRLFPRASQETILKAFPGRTWMGIARYAWLKGIPRPRKYHWTDEEKRILEKHYPHGAPSEIQTLLPRHSWTGIQCAATRSRIYRSHIKEEKLQVRIEYG